MFETIHPHLWMLVPVQERQIIAQAFELPRTGTSEVRDDYVVSDGYSAADLEHISRERMAEYVGEKPDTDLSIPRLWELTVAKARSIANPPIATIVADQVAEAEQPASAPNPKKNAKRKAV